MQISSLTHPHACRRNAFPRAKPAIAPRGKTPSRALGLIRSLTTCPFHAQHCLTWRDLWKLWISLLGRRGFLRDGRLSLFNGWMRFSHPDWEDYSPRMWGSWTECLPTHNGYCPTDCPDAARPRLASRGANRFDRELHVCNMFLIFESQGSQGRFCCGPFSFSTVFKNKKMFRAFFNIFSSERLLILLSQGWSCLWHGRRLPAQRYLLGIGATFGEMRCKLRSMPLSGSLDLQQNAWPVNGVYVPKKAIDLENHDIPIKFGSFCYYYYESQPVGLAEVISASEASLGGLGPERRKCAKIGSNRW